MKNYLLSIIAVLFFTSLNAHVNIIYPEGGEVFDPGQEVTIEWEIIIQHDTQNWDLYFSTDGGATWEDLELNIHPDTLYYMWTVPDEATSQARIRVVQDNSGFDYEDESGDFTITEVVGIAELYSGDFFRIYPNPAKDFVFVESANEFMVEEIEIFSSHAKRLFRHVSFPDYALLKRQWIPLDGLMPGIYFLQVKTDKEQLTRKIIIQ